MREKIKEALKRVLEMENIPNDVSQSNCAQWDSLKHLNLIVDLEEDFNVSFEPEDIAEMKSLEMIEVVLKRISE